MMSLFEPLFDIGYLGLVIGLGVRLLLEDDKHAKLFGIMAILLGVGDGFHLLPRIVSHLTVNGFEKNIVYLSWGEFVTSITMTIFYVLFYHYYKTLSNDHNKSKQGLIYLLALIRIVLVLLPYNLWGTQGDYVFGIVRNIPFALMGLLLIYWTYQFRHVDGLKYTSLLILLSFAFYIPVVVGARFIPLLGAFMIPKTIAYVLLVLVGFRYFIRDFKSTNILKNSVTFLIMGLCGGVFYREFTKLYEFEGNTTLSLVHVHLIVLGFLVLLVVYSVFRQSESDLRSMGKALRVYGVGLTWLVTTLVMKGIYNVTSNGVSFYSPAAFSGIAGIGHIILSIGIVMVLVRMIELERV